MNPGDSLADLALIWALDHKMIPGGLMEWTCEKFDDSPITDRIVDSITKHEPFRSQVLEDAKFYLRGPVPLLGASVEIADKLCVTPFQHWGHTISPFLYTVHFWLSMSTYDSDRDRFDYELDRVVFEDGQWKVASIYSDESREKTMKALREMWELLEKRSSQA